MNLPAAGLIAVICAAVVGAQTAHAPDVDAVLQRMHAFLESYEAELTAVIAEERYEQHTEANALFQRRALETNTQTLDSDMAFVRLPGNAAWYGFRDVRKVNGKPVAEGGTRLKDLATGSATFLEQARAITIASSKHNLGTARTINMPLVPLELLAARHRDRFRYVLGGRDTIGGAKTIRLEFEETASPTIVQFPQGGDVISYGTANVEIETGRVWRVVLAWRSPDRPPAPPGAHRTAMRVDFAVDKRLGLIVPVKMQESFLVGNGNGSGTATYRNFRRFATSGRVVP